MLPGSRVGDDRPAGKHGRHRRAHVADAWWDGVYPFIDHSTGGNVDGMIGAAPTTSRA